ncbi:MAG TPA: Holliday junction branch migration protein RuvA [bacterium]|nr:Holliday junction branch migration protein RuvA [bacterium]
MIAYLSGLIKFKTEKSIVLDVHNVGYEIFLSQQNLEKNKLGVEKSFFIHLHMREDSLELFGFETEEEKRFFELLISVSGVGPKSALAVLSMAKLNELKQAILKNDATLLRKVSGIGQKTAERLIVELKNKLREFALNDEDKNNSHQAGSDTFNALESLGYSTNEIREALRQIDAQIEDENEIIKSALKILGKNKK